MSRFRILEKRGEYKNTCLLKGKGCKESDTCHTLTYAPRFIIQKAGISNHYCLGKIEGFEALNYEEPIKDLKEFTSLEEAREYKRDLELDEGIVRE